MKLAEDFNIAIDFGDIISDTSCKLEEIKIKLEEVGQQADDLFSRMRGLIQVD